MARIESADKIYEHEESGAMTSAAIGRRTRFQIRLRASAPHQSLNLFHRRSRPSSQGRAVKNLRLQEGARETIFWKSVPDPG